MESRNSFIDDVKEATENLNIKYDGHKATISGDEAVLFRDSAGVKEGVVKIEDVEKVTTMNKYQVNNNDYMRNVKIAHDRLVESSPSPSTISGEKGVVFRGTSKEIMNGKINK